MAIMPVPRYRAVPRRVVSVRARPLSAAPPLRRGRDAGVRRTFTGCLGRRVAEAGGSVEAGIPVTSREE
jgi:hypothetical protein